MRTIFAPTYATLSMGCFEQTFNEICINESGGMLSQLILGNQCQFLDDCKTPLEKTKNDTNRLLETLNSINPSIKFKMQISDKELLFLDILIKTDDHKIWMDIYFKPTDTCWCLLFMTSHPNHCKKNINYPSTKNLCNSGKSTTEIKTSVRIKGKPKKYGYSLNIITNGIKKALKSSK